MFTVKTKVDIMYLEIHLVISKVFIKNLIS